MTALPKSAAPLAHKIKHWDDEREDGNPIMVTLAHGWAFYDNDVDDAAGHVQGAANVAEAVRDVRGATPCKCSRCVS